MPVVAIPLVALLAFLAAVGVYLLAVTEKYWLKPLTDSLAGLFGHIPVVGAFMAREIVKAEHAVAHWLGQAAIAVERPAVHLLYALGHLVGQLAYTIANDAARTYHALQVIVSGKLPAALRVIKTTTVEQVPALTRRLLVPLRATTVQLVHAVNGLAHELAGVEAKVASLARAVAHATAVAIPQALPWIRGEVARVEGLTLRHLRLRLSRLEKLIGAGALAGFVVAVIARRLPWLRCRNVNSLARHACRLPVKALEDLLAGIVDVLLLSDLCRIVTAMTAAAREASPLIEGISSAVTELIHCQQHERPAPLAVAWHAPPPVVSSLTLG